MISLTEQAATKIKQQLTKRGKGLGIRIGVKTTGCSGLAYVLEYVDKFYEGDHIFESQGVHVYVDAKSMAYITGLEMDWVRNGLNEGFEFRNPNSKGECGCGESFRV
jgi:iron-sulfur cluster assembly protein